MAGGVFDLFDELTQDFLSASQKPLIMAIPPRSSVSDNVARTSSNPNNSVGLFNGSPNRIRLDVKETDRNYEIHAELAGVPRENIKLNLEDRVLTVEAETHKESDKEDPTHHYHVRERSYGILKRSLRLPENIDESNVKAAYNNGVLTITVGKNQEPQSKKTSIPIQ